MNLEDKLKTCLEDKGDIIEYLTRELDTKKNDISDKFTQLSLSKESQKKQLESRLEDQESFYLEKMERIENEKLLLGFLMFFKNILLYSRLLLIFFCI